jgi:hypothetical protein
MSQSDVSATLPSMRADEVQSAAPTRYGAYLCLNISPTAGKEAAAAIEDLIRRFDLSNEFEPAGSPAARTIAFLRRTDVSSGTMTDNHLADATAIVHVSSEEAAPLVGFRDELDRVAGRTHALAGVVRPLRYTGREMHNFAYAHRVLQQPGAVMPAAFLLPLSKVAAWWKKDWMERQTYFLPRYDTSGRMINQGHALAAAAGIPCLMRRTYWNPREPAPQGEYDFINYFECADEDVPTFHGVCAALRDTKRNPEWTFVREGPTWHGRRVPTWDDLFE